jgi:hypothetical protein
MMCDLSHEHVAALRAQLDRGTLLSAALPSALGRVRTSDGLWRFYSDIWPGQGLEWWNSESPWKIHWQRFLPQGLFSFAEDVFGNQLVVIAGYEEVYLLNHENAEGHTLYVNPVELLSSVVESGIDWIDFYANGSLRIAREFGVVPEGSHLHWTAPLILGGSVTCDNLSVVPRDQHHIGHAKLWAQISQLPAGTQIISQSR